MTLRDQIWRHEGFRAKPYKDTRGIWTGGVGHNLENGPPIAAAVWMMIYDDDLKYFQAQMLEAFPWVKGIDMPRVAVLLDMLFNMGLPRLQGFRNMLSAMSEHSWLEAAAALRDSDYWRKPDTHTRAEALAQQLESGEWNEN